MVRGDRAVGTNHRQGCAPGGFTSEVSTAAGEKSGAAIATSGGCSPRLQRHCTGLKAESVKRGVWQAGGSLSPRWRWGERPCCDYRMLYRNTAAMEGARADAEHPLDAGAAGPGRDKDTPAC